MFRANARKKIRPRFASELLGPGKTARALRARRKNKLQCAHDYAAFENALQTKRRFSGADPHRDDRAEPECARLRSNPESLADHRRFGRQDRHHARARKRSDSISLDL